MDIISLDWESYYDPATKYSLSSMSTEDYVCDPRFEEILVSAKVNGEPTDWFSGTRSQFTRWLGQFDLPNNALLAQNTRFDGLILAKHHGIIPRFYFDTLAMARRDLKPVCKRLGLKYLCEHLGLPPKGDEVMHVQGMRREDFSHDALQRYAEYCMTDTDLTWQVFNLLKVGFPTDDLRLIDMTLRMYLEPQFRLKSDVFIESLIEVRARKEKIFTELELQGITKETFSSNNKFADILRDRGIDPPMKPSPASVKKGEDPPKMTYAFSKADPELIELQEAFAEDGELSAIFQARTESKSTIEETRCIKYQEIAEKYGLFRVPLVPFGAHTGRYTGDEGLNVLNLSNPDPTEDPVTGEIKYRSRLRFGVVPRDSESTIVGADLSQIEARILATIAGQTDLVQAFASGECVYSLFATDMFARPVSKQLAKTDPRAARDRACGKATILGAGFGMGAKKYRRQVRGKGLNLTEEESETFVGFYRARYESIPMLWGTYTTAINQLAVTREEQQIGPLRFHWMDDNVAAIESADGRRLLYPKLRVIRKKDKYDETKTRLQAVCTHAGDKFPRPLWGGVITENVCQHLAAIVIKRIMLDVRQETGYNTGLQIYDECLWNVAKSDAADFKIEVAKIMRRKVDFLPDCPIDCEVKSGDSYGDV